MSHVWTWVHANPGLTTILLLAAIISTYTLLATISSHLLLGWKAFLANFAPPPVINQVVAEDDEDDDDDDDEPPAVNVARSTQSATDTGKRPTRFDRINNS